jgi:hypothetical protein
MGCLEFGDYAFGSLVKTHGEDLVIDSRGEICKPEYVRGEPPEKASLAPGCTGHSSSRRRPLSF